MADKEKFVASHVRVRFIRAEYVNAVSRLRHDSVVLDHYVEGSWFPDPHDPDVRIAPSAVLSMAPCDSRGYTKKDLERPRI